MNARPLLLVPTLAAVAMASSFAFAKPKPADPPPAPPPAPAPAPAPAPEPAPAPAPEVASKPKNADLNLTITYTDGHTKSGHVTGIERTSDYTGDAGWTSADADLKLTVESGTSEKNVAWKDVKTITITPGKMPDDMSCTYSSDFSPWMYDCTITTTAAAALKDGSKGNVTNRHHWKFYFDDDSSVEVQVYKYSVREQDDRELEYGDDAGENFALYTKLQGKLRTDLKTNVVKSITVQ